MYFPSAFFFSLLFQDEHVGFQQAFILDSPVHPICSLALYRLFLAFAPAIKNNRPARSSTFVELRLLYVSQRPCAFCGGAIEIWPGLSL